jgi:uncharacterized protein
VTHDFNDGFLKAVAHRPWPLPESPWVMRQTWNDLLFAHWPVQPQLLASKIPPQLPLDVYDGHAWIAVVPFHMTNVAPRGVPALPWVSAFPELNVRTYVRIHDKPGVYFFSLDAANPLAVSVARTLIGLPYFSASMRVQVTDGAVRYRSRRARRPHAELIGTYRPVGPVFEPVPGSLEYFLTERYCLYHRNHRNVPYRLEIHHPPWTLQPARGHLLRNEMADINDIALPHSPPLLHFAKRQDMVAWAPTSIEAEVACAAP